MLTWARRFAVACAFFSLAAPLAFAAARAIPEDVTVKIFAQPPVSRQGNQQGNQLEVLVRVPLAAVKDIQMPTKGDAGYLDLDAIKSMLPGAARYWIANCLEVRENGTILKPEIAAARISATSDQSFNSHQEASGHLNSPDLPADSQVFWDQVWFDIRFVYPLAAEHSDISIRPTLASLGVRVNTDLEYVAPDGGTRDFSFEGDPGLIYLNATWADAAKQFIRHGAAFVITSADFLLFLFCLAFPFRHYRDFIPAVVAFGIALSIALLTATFGLSPDALWFHPLIETLAAVSILLTAFANIGNRVTPRRRALLALAVGFIFGFSCSFDLAAKAQFGGSHIVTSALAFNIGVLVAVVLAVALLIPIVSFLFSFARTENLERIIVSALAADTAWGWLDERWGRLSKIPIQLVFDAGILAVTLRCLAVLVLFGGLLWFVDEWLKSRTFTESEPSAQSKSRTAV
jgi:hypothetical protein